MKEKKDANSESKYIISKEIKCHIDSIKKELDDTDHLVKTIDSMWQGEDKEKFLKDFNDEVDKVKKELDNLTMLNKK